MTYSPSQDRYATMTYNRCGNSGLLLPALSLGLWHNFGEDVAFALSRDICRTAFDSGITHFDLANNYGPPPGAAESTFGRILRSDFAAHRDELIISTKAGYLMWPGPYGEFSSRKYLLASLDQIFASAISCKAIWARWSLEREPCGTFWDKQPPWPTVRPRTATRQ